MNNSEFCESHKNNISVFRCSKCARGVCSRCSISASSFCPKCRGRNILKDESEIAKNEIRNILISGVAMSLIAILIISVLEGFELNFNKDLIFNSIVFFAFGISFASSIYFVNKTAVFDEVQEIPLIGTTVMRYLLIGTSIIGIPIFYFFYLIYQSKKPR
ncbi:MAG: hypothetical protein JKY08_07270 [Flavobacteriaceae bacterium]|nr:hypothetical protein [Flavobacteriaceae bacterium]